MINKKSFIYLILVIFIFNLVFNLVLPTKVLALASPITVYDWIHNFRSSGIIDKDRSNVDWSGGNISLPASNNGFSGSAVCWTKQIGFREDIKSITLNGSMHQPNGTIILVYISFEGDNREYPLHWGQKYEPEEITTRFKLKIFLATTNYSVSPEVSELKIRAELQDRSEKGLERRDRDRTKDLEQTKKLLDNYAKDFEQYPVVSLKPNLKEDQWRILKEILVSAGINHGERYSKGIPDQAIQIDEEYQYGYLSNSYGSTYLLWIQLEDVDSEYLINEDRWQGELFGVHCTGKTYCLSNRVSQISEPLIRVFDDKGGYKVNNNSFIQAKGDDKVWFKAGDWRIWLRTPKVFQSIGGIWDQITLIAGLGANDLAKFITSKNDNKVWLVENGLKRHVLDPRALGFYGSFKEVIEVDDNLIDALPENQLIRAKGKEKIYFLSDKIKRWITSPDTFRRLGFDFSEVVDIDPREMEYYPEANPLF